MAPTTRPPIITLILLTTALGALSVQAAPPFQYSPTSGSCNGYYEGEFRECGHIKEGTFEGKDLSKQNLKGIKITGNFRGANFYRADLTGAQLNGVNLSQANLQLVDFSNTIVNEVNFKSANLTMI